MESLLSNQVALITGSTAGIGKAIAKKLAEEGAQVILLGTNVDRGKEAVEEIQNSTGRHCASFYPVDVSNTTAVDDVLKEILSKSPKIDILINNAGITRDQLLMKMTEEDWDRVLDVNVKSCYNTCRALVRTMLKAKRGKIINVSSVVGLTGNTGQVNYAASKAAMIGFTKALAKELASRNICVNCIAPGFIETKMTEAFSPDLKEKWCQTIPLGRFGSAVDVANAALFLASHLADYITGQVITVDGGLVMC
jgi:3-oxoacyl-[acyl-carrier protein] reductase